MGKLYSNEETSYDLFEAGINRPIDDRFVIADRASLIDLNTWLVEDENTVYSGIIVAVTDSDADKAGIYYLKNAAHYTGFAEPLSGETEYSDGWFRLLSIEEWESYKKRNEATYASSFSINTNYAVERIFASGNVSVLIPAQTYKTDEVKNYTLFIDNSSGSAITVTLPSLTVDGHTCHIMGSDSLTFTVAANKRFEIDVILTNEDVTIHVWYSQTSIVYYSVTFSNDSTKGTISGTTSFTVPSGKTLAQAGVTIPTITANTGWAFTGWGDTTSPITQNTTFTAVYDTDLNHNGIADSTETHVSVTFDAGAHGLISGQSQLVYSNKLPGCTFAVDEITIPTPTPSTDYVFDGWDTEISSSTIVPTSNITYTALYFLDLNGNNIDDTTETHYTVQFTAGTGGTITGTSTYSILTGISMSRLGITALPTATPNTGYHLDSWYPSNPSLSTVITSDVNYVASFAQTQYTLSITNPTGLTITASYATPLVYGTEVTLAYAEQSTRFASWTVTCGNQVIPVTDNKFTMPAGNVEVTATTQSMTFAIANHLTNATTNNSATTAAYNTSYSATITPASDYTLTGASVSIVMGTTDITSTAYSNGVISIDHVIGNVSITITAVLLTHTVTLGTVTHGTITASPLTAHAGDTITLTKSADTGYEFSSWSTSPTVTITNDTFVMPASDITVSATFTAILHSITIPTFSHGTATVSPASAGVGDTVTLTITPDSGYEVDTITITYSGGTVTPTGSGNVYTFTMPNGDVSIAVTMKSSTTTYTLTLTATNGTVTLNPSGGTYPAGTSVVATVTPSSGYTFEKWSDDNTSNPRTFVMNSNITLSASCITSIGSDRIQYTASVDLTSSAPSVLGTANIVTSSCTYDSTTQTGVLVYDSTLTLIDFGAFYNLTNLLSITLPSTVTLLGGSAFAGCSHLSNVSMPGIATGGSEAFHSCYELTSVTMSSIVTIEYGQFMYCTALSTINIPATVTAINQNSFAMCTSLATINYAGTSTQWNSITKGTGWHNQVPATVVHCSDGDVNI